MRCLSIDTGENIAGGFCLCNQLSACLAQDIDSNIDDGGNIAAGFITCKQISSCKASDIDAVGAGNAYGFSNCSYGVALYTDETCITCTFINAGTDEYSCPTGLTP